MQDPRGAKFLSHLDVSTVVVTVVVNGELLKTRYYCVQTRSYWFVVRTANAMLPCNCEGLPMRISPNPVKLWLLPLLVVKLGRHLLFYLLDACTWMNVIRLPYCRRGNVFRFTPDRCCFSCMLIVFLFFFCTPLLHFHCSFHSHICVFLSFTQMSHFLTHFLWFTINCICIYICNVCRKCILLYLL